MINDAEFRPGWMPGDFEAAPAAVGLLLRRGSHALRLAEAKRRFEGSSWFSRQFDITARAAHASYHSNLSVISQLSGDASRVLRLIHDDWEGYLSRVNRARTLATAQAVIHAARAGYAELYVFILTELLQRPWRTHATGMEASALSVWRKIGVDNQYLWNFPQFRVLMGW